jgi:hypothetical protein
MGGAAFFVLPFYSLAAASLEHTGADRNCFTGRRSGSPLGDGLRDRRHTSKPPNRRSRPFTVSRMVRRPRALRLHQHPAGIGLIFALVHPGWRLFKREASTCAAAGNASPCWRRSRSPRPDRRHRGTLPLWPALAFRPPDLTPIAARAAADDPPKESTGGRAPVAPLFVAKGGGLRDGLLGEASGTGNTSRAGRQRIVAAARGGGHDSR